MEPSSEPLVRQVGTLTQPLLEREGVELVELTVRQQGPQWVVKFLVDTPQGITLRECARLNGHISQVLDQAGAFGEAGYVVEVNSPGLDRPLKTPRDFTRVLGKRVEVTTAVPVANKVTHRGQVIDVNDERVRLVIAKGATVDVPLAQITRATLEISFS